LRSTGLALEQGLLPRFGGDGIAQLGIGIDQIGLGAFHRQFQ
jgi:hypothetical protein